MPGNNGVFQPTVVVDGRIVGTWKRVIKSRAVVVTVDPFAPLPKSAQRAIEKAADAYGRFMGTSVDVTLV